MKNLRTIAVCIGVTLCNLSSFGQTGSLPVNEPNRNKPKLFQALPDNIPASMTNLTSLFNSQVGDAVNLNLSETGNFQFEGYIVSAVSKYNTTIQSVVVRSSNYPGASLSVTMTNDPGGSLSSYTARIISKQHGDLFELKNINNQFVLVKRNFYDLINE